MWHQIEEIPESGRRIVAVFNDCSGATLLLRHDNGFTAADGDEKPTIEHAYCKWAYLQDDMKLWFED